MAVPQVIATVLCAVAVAGCAATDGAEPAGATCDQFARSPVVEQSRSVETGADLTIVLCSNPTTGFAWGEPEIADASVVQLADRTFREPSASPAVLGAAGTEILTLHGAAAGTTTLTINYGQPWAGGAKETWVYRLRVTVG